MCSVPRLAVTSFEPSVPRREAELVTSMRRTLVTAWLVVVTLAASPALGQNSDPKQRFTEALGSLTAALDGRFGDDGPRVTASVAALERALADWDEAMGRQQAMIDAELRTSSAQAGVRLHLALALALAERGRVDGAVTQLEAALAVSPRDVDANTVLGLVHSQLTANTAAATQALRTAVAADPTAPLQRYLLVKQLADQGAFEEAATLGLPLRMDTRNPDAPDRSPFLRIHLIPEVAGVEPYFPYSRYTQAFALLARGQYSEGVSALKAAMAGDPFLAMPDSAKPDLSQAGAALRDGDAAAALASIDRAQRAAPMWSELHRLRGIALVAAERTDVGIAELREAVRIEPSDERSHVELAAALVEEERYDDADAALRSALTILPQSARLHHARGRVLQRQGLYPEALAEFERALSLQPSLPLLGRNSVYNTIATLRRARQEFEEATKAFAVRANLVPNDVSAHRDLGDIYFRRGLDDVAWNEFAVAEAIAPRDVATQASLAQLHLRAGRNEEAAAVARRIIRLDPEHTQAHFVLGTALVRMDRTEEGTRELATFSRLEAAEADARTRELELSGLRREAEVSAGLGDHTREVALLSQLVEKAPQLADAHVALGVALLNAGRAADAVEELQRAAGLGAFGDVYRHLADAYSALGQTEQSARARDVYARIRRDVLREAARQ